MAGAIIGSIEVGDGVLVLPAPTYRAILSALCLMGLQASACTHTVRVKSPQEPITINLNINLQADVRVRLEEKAQEDISENPEIF